MTRSLLTVSLLAAAALGPGCASSPPKGPYAPSGSVPGVMDETRPPPGPSGFTSRPDCDKLVDHLDKLYFMSSHEREIWRAPNQRPGWHRARVDECTITVDHYDRDCLLGSNDLSTAAQCNSKFFADTLQSYREL
jgi:hypothetical protein